MKYPDFFKNIEPIILQDDLSNFLGTFENGIVEFNYVDIVKASGHSCPTVAGAYISTLYALKELFNEKELPRRGDIMVAFKDDSVDGVTGVIANVISNITGAADESGFKGINGNFARCDLMIFNCNIKTPLKFIRLDTNESVEVIYDPSSIPADPRQNEIMGKIMEHMATDEEKKEFGALWQKRVKAIFENIDKVVTIKKG